MGALQISVQTIPECLEVVVVNVVKEGANDVLYGLATIAHNPLVSVWKTGRRICISSVKPAPENQRCCITSRCRMRGQVSGFALWIHMGIWLVSFRRTLAQNTSIGRWPTQVAHTDTLH